MNSGYYFENLPHGDVITRILLWASRSYQVNQYSSTRSKRVLDEQKQALSLLFSEDVKERK